MKLPLIQLYILASCLSCNAVSVPLIKLSGAAQGTTYHVSYFSPGSADYQKEIDSLLRALDTSLSTYNPFSVISKFNQNDDIVKADEHFTSVFDRAIAVAEMTDGQFDITVAPIVNAWGFGFAEKEKINSAKIDSLLKYVGFRKIALNKGRLVKEHPLIMLDFNAIAQGYSVDRIAEFLESKNISNYLVELGGEVKAKGQKPGKEMWKIGIERPGEVPETDDPYQAVLPLYNRAMATSGNYRRFYEENGRKYGHIIDPRTGYPAKHSLLSATVFADDCMTADAYATAFMVMGMEKAIQFLALHKTLNLEVFFIFDDNGKWKTYYSRGLEQSLKKVN